MTVEGEKGANEDATVRQGHLHPPMKEGHHLTTAIGHREGTQRGGKAQMGRAEREKERLGGREREQGERPRGMRGANARRCCYSGGGVMEEERRARGVDRWCVGRAVDSRDVQGR